MPITWIAYADRKPKVQDGNKIGLILWTKDGTMPKSDQWDINPHWTFWARINPPPKPQGEVEKCKNELALSLQWATNKESSSLMNDVLNLIRAVVREEKP